MPQLRDELVAPLTGSTVDTYPTNDVECRVGSSTARTDLSDDTRVCNTTWFIGRVRLTIDGHGHDIPMGRDEER